MEKSLEQNIGYYYLGLLPKHLNRVLISQILKMYGRILRLRFSKDKKTTENKGYGYCIMQLRVPEEKFLSGLLDASPPLYAFRLVTPKNLGCENTKVVRCYARIDGPNVCLSQSDLAEYLENFGPTQVIIFDSFKTSPHVARRVHIIYERPESIDKLLQDEILQNSHFFDPRSLKTFIGMQEAPIDYIYRVQTVFKKHTRNPTSTIKHIPTPLCQPHQVSRLDGTSFPKSPLVYSKFKAAQSIELNDSQSDACLKSNFKGAMPPKLSKKYSTLIGGFPSTQEDVVNSFRGDTSQLKLSESLKGPQKVNANHSLNNLRFNCLGSR